VDARKFVLLFGGANTSATGADWPFAPALTWNGSTADRTPDFDVDISSGNGAPYDTATNDVLRIEYSANSGANWSAYLTHSFSSGEIAGNPITVSGVTPLANGAYLFRARIERGSNESAWSASAAVTVVSNITWYILGF
jgi:hypothetical protein